MTTTTANTYEGLTAEQWRAKAQEEQRDAADSWDRSDTDGLLTQWAHRSIAQEYEVKAQLAESDGYAEFFALFDPDGKRLYAEQVEGKFGPSYRIYDVETRRTIRWFSESTALTEKVRNANNLKKGVVFGKVRAKAQVHSYGTAAGTVAYGVRPVDPDMIDGEFIGAWKES
jgi:hypothetical protein